MPEPFKAQRQIDAADLPDANTNLRCCSSPSRGSRRAGYVYIGMDHFALPDDDLAAAQERGSLHRNFMGYTTHADSDLIGLGVSAISHIGDSFSQNPRDLPSWQIAIDEAACRCFAGCSWTRTTCLVRTCPTVDVSGRVPVAALERRYAIDLTILPMR